MNDPPEPGVSEPAEGSVDSAQSLAKTLFEASPIACVIADGHGRIRRVNAAFSALLGYSRDEAVELTVADITHDDDRALTAQKMKSVLRAGGVAVRYEKRYLHRDGRSVCGIASVSRLADEHGEPLVLGQIVDISAQHAAAEELARVNERLALATESAGVGILDIDLVSQRGYCNPTLRRLYGLTPEAGWVSRREFMSVVHEDDRERMDRVLAAGRNSAGPEVFEDEFRVVRSGGVVRRLRGAGRVVRDGTGTALRLLGAVVDITELGDSVQRLRASLQFSMTLFERSPAGIALLLPDGTIERANPAYCALLGRGIEQLRGRRVQEFTHADDVTETDEHLARVGNGEMHDAQYEKRYLRPDGAVVWISARVAEIRDENGAPRVLASVADITASKRMHAELEQLTDRLKLATTGAGVGVWDLDVSSRQIVCDDIVLDLHGVKAADGRMSLQQWLDVIDVDDARQIRSVIDERLKVGGGNEFRFEYRIRLGNDKTRWVSSVGWIQRDRDGVPMRAVGINQDVSEQKRAQRELAASVVMLQTQQEMSPDGILVVDSGMRVLSRNPRFVEMMRIPPALQDSDCAIPLLDHAVEQVAEPAAFRARVQWLYEHRTETSADEIVFKDGRVFERYTAPMSSDNGGHLGRIWFFHDVTERRAALEKLRRVNRALTTLSAATGAMIHAASEAVLYAEMCRIMIDIGGYRLAWVGRPEFDAAKSVAPVAFAGYDAGYLATAQISWAESERGQGATGRCVRSGVPQVLRLSENAASPWRAEAEKRGYASSIALPLKDHHGVFGTLTIHSAEAQAFDEDEIALLVEMSGDLSFGVNVLRARVEHDGDLRRLGRIMEDTVHAIAGTVEMRDPYTAGHQRHVAKLCVAIASRLGLSEERIHGLDLAASIHDLGKISIPAEILSKPGRLTAIEMQLVRMHTDIGYEIVKNVDFPWPIAEMIRQHHERLDGSGYPRGLKGDEILLEARIIAVADTVEAMAAHRPYRPGLGIEAALQEIARERGTALDAGVVDACIAVVRDGTYDPTS